MNKKIIYSGDPLCAWCFGFTEIFEKIINRYSDRISFSIIMGGLRVENSVMIDESVKESLHKNWTSVSKKTGQEISTERISELPEGRYNSEPPCRAVVTVRSLKPQAVFSYYKKIHRAFYIDMQNINDPNLLYELASEAGISKKDFLSLYDSDEIISETQNDFLTSEASGVLGFPALVLEDDTGKVVLNQGYKPLDTIINGIDSWLEGKKPGFF